MGTKKATAIVYRTFRVIQRAEIEIEISDSASCDTMKNLAVDIAWQDKTVAWENDAPPTTDNVHCSGMKDNGGAQ